MADKKKSEPLTDEDLDAAQGGFVAPGSAGFKEKRDEDNGVIDIMVGGTSREKGFASPEGPYKRSKKGLKVDGDFGPNT